MKTQIQRQENVSRTIQNKTKAANQANVHSVLQKYTARSVQRQADNGLEEDMIQGKFETAQREGVEDEEPLQGKFSGTVQREESLPPKNETGIPDNMKAGFENLSGFSFDDVRVHYNSDKPAQLQALAYTQGNQVHIAPGQEKHLGHELGHVVQQKQGRVQPTMQLQGVNVNDNIGLEKEADVMGGKAKDIDGEIENDIVQLEEGTNCRIIQKVPKLILGRREDTGVGSYQNSESYYSKNSQTTPGSKKDKRNRVLNMTGWDINKNTEWIRTGKVANPFVFRQTVYDSATGKDTSASLGTEKKGIFKIITELPPRCRGELVNMTISRRGVEEDPAFSDSFSLTTSQTPKNKFLRYVCRFHFGKTELMTGNRYTVLAQEIQQLLNANYIFREVPRKKGKNNVLMAFADVNSYKKYYLEKWRSKKTMERPH